jgi:hypothetical protein
MKKINKRSPKKWHGKIADAVGEARCVWQGDVKILMTPELYQHLVGTYGNEYGKLKYINGAPVIVDNSADLDGYGVIGVLSD